MDGSDASDSLSQMSYSTLKSLETQFDSRLYSFKHAISPDKQCKPLICFSSLVDTPTANYGWKG
jgi:hypothetical protein